MKKKPLQIAPAATRVASTRRIRKTYYDDPRCSILTKAGTQCTRTLLGTGAAGRRFQLASGEQIVVCGLHLDQFLAERPTVRPATVSLGGRGE